MLRFAAVTTDAGPLTLYRDRDAHEIRDISVVRKTPDGWTPPASVHADAWTTPGCPVNGPQGVADGQHVAAAWYTGAGGTGRVRVVQSTDGGATFGPPIDLDTRAPLGRVGLASLPDGEVVVSWLGAAPRGAAEGDPLATIRLARVARDGRVGEPYALASVHASRASGFPRIRRHGDQLIVVWTHVFEPSNRKAKKRAVTGLRAVHLPWSVVPAPRAPGPKTAPDPIASAVAIGALVDLQAMTLDGHPTRLASLRGKPVLLNLWATWCKPCREELPALEALRQAHPGVQVVALSVDAAGDADEVRRFARDAGLRATLWHDPSGARSSVLGATALPMTLLLDGDGRVRWRRDGPITADEPELKRALEANP